MKPSNPVQMQKVTNQGAAFIDSFFGNLVGGVVGVLEGGGKAVNQAMGNFGAKEENGIWVLDNSV